MKKKSNPSRLFLRLVRIMERLRGPEGCPWDRRQTHRTLVPYLFSEAEEVKSAVRKNDRKNLEEELGDILLQVVFHSQLAAEKGLFDIADVVRGINEKLVRRHPHVFGGKKLRTAGQVTRQWQQIKAEEKKAKAARPPKRSRRA